MFNAFDRISKLFIPFDDNLMRRFATFTMRFFIRPWRMIVTCPATMVTTFQREASAFVGAQLIQRIMPGVFLPFVAELIPLLVDVNGWNNCWFIRGTRFRFWSARR